MSHRLSSLYREISVREGLSKDHHYCDNCGIRWVSVPVHSNERNYYNAQFKECPVCYCSKIRFLKSERRD